MRRPMSVPDSSRLGGTALAWILLHPDRTAIGTRLRCAFHLANIIAQMPPCHQHAPSTRPQSASQSHPEEVAFQYRTSRASAFGALSCLAALPDPRRRSEIWVHQARLNPQTIG